MTDATTKAFSPHPGLGFREFVGLIAAMMAVNAVAIDVMLPAMPQIGNALGIVDANQRQWIITAYMLGLGGAQLFYGSLADRFGRKPVLLIALSLYALFSFVAAFASSFALMIAARSLQGAASAAMRVLSISIVRDCYSGRQMARVMSLSFIIFMAVPILAPSIGQIVLLLAPWRWIFGVLGIFGSVVALWSALRLPETLHPEYRVPITFSRLGDAARKVLTDRTSVGYSAAMTLLVGGLFGFINSVQQIFFDVFHAPHLFTIIFALVAASMAVASFINSRIVERLGTRCVSHAAMFGFVFFAVVHLMLALAGMENIWTFAVVQAAMMGCFGLSSANFGSMAMESLGEVAGMASSIQGFITTVGGALIGILIGQQFNGTTVPVYMGFSVLGVLTIIIVLITEKGRLFVAHHPAVKH